MLPTIKSVSTGAEFSTLGGADRPMNMPTDIGPDYDLVVSVLACRDTSITEARARNDYGYMDGTKITEVVDSSIYTRIFTEWRNTTWADNKFYIRLPTGTGVGLGYVHFVLDGHSIQNYELVEGSSMSSFGRHVAAPARTAGWYGSRKGMPFWLTVLCMNQPGDDSTWPDAPPPPSTDITGWGITDMELVAMFPGQYQGLSLINAPYIDVGIHTNDIETLDAVSRVIQPSILLNTRVSTHTVVGVNLPSFQMMGIDTLTGVDTVTISE